MGLIVVGNIVDINWKGGTATHGTLIGNQAARGGGFGRDVIMANMRYAFEELRLHGLVSTKVDSNAASLRAVVEKCGWVVEGRRREWIVRENRHLDNIVVGVSCADYEVLLERTGYWRAPHE